MEVDRGGEGQEPAPLAALAGAPSTSGPSACGRAVGCPLAVFLFLVVAHPSNLVRFPVRFHAWNTSIDCAQWVLRRDLDPGERAGLAAGERAARRHDVFLARPRGWRNEVWETKHVQEPVLAALRPALATCGYFSATASRPGAQLRGEPCAWVLVLHGSRCADRPLSVPGPTLHH